MENVKHCSSQTELPCGTDVTWRKSFCSFRLLTRRTVTPPLQRHSGVLLGAIVRAGKLRDRRGARV